MRLSFNKYKFVTRTVAGLSLATVPLISLAASCGTSSPRVDFADNNFKFVSSQYTPVTSVTLQESASLITNELNVPWRRGVAYESLSHAVSLLYALATKLGWSEADFNRRESRITLDEQDQNLTGIKARYQPEFSNITGNTAADFDLIMEDLLKIRQTKPITPTQQLSAILGIGNDTLDSNIGATNFYNLSYDGINFKNQRYLDIKSRIAKTDVITITSLDAHPIKISLRADWEKPGSAYALVRVYNTNYARQIHLDGVSPIYPEISETKINELAPLIKNLMASFPAYFLAPGIVERFMDAVVPATIIDIVKFFQTITTNIAPNAYDSQLVTALKELNNGSFHFLAIEAFAKGFAAEMFNNDETQPLREVINYVQGAPLSGNLAPLLGMDAMGAGSKAFQLFLPYQRFNLLSIGPTARYIYTNDPQQSGHLAYYLSPSEDALTLNGVELRVKPVAII